MNDKVKNELDRIVNTLADTGIVSRILLFGSYAKGKETAKSDIDICVLSPVKPESHIQFIAGFLTLLWDVSTTPLDLLAYNQDEFYFHAKRKTSFEHEIAETGVMIYEHR
ncbi:hypothetical protein R80B4_02429 [Fibrobacteres bacterium R8-0-B4]